MRKARRHPQLPMVLLRQSHAHPLAEVRRAFTDIDGDIEYLTFNYTHELPLSVFDLIMQPAQYAACRTRMVVLDELDARFHLFGKLTAVKALVEIAACITEHLRLDNLDFGQRRSSYLDGHAT